MDWPVRFAIEKRMEGETTKFQIEELEEALGAKFGDPPFYYGLMGNAPFLFKQIDTDTANPGYLFKFRKTMAKPKGPPPGIRGKVSIPPPPRVYQRPIPISQQQGGAADTAEPDSESTLSSNRAPGGSSKSAFESEVDEKYLWVWVRQVSGLSGTEVADLAKSAVDTYADCFRGQPGECMFCFNKDGTEVRQIGSEVTLVCETCLEKREARRESIKRDLDKPMPFQGVIGPLLLVVASAGWAGLWYGLGALPQDRILVPRILLLALFVVIPFAGGRPIGGLLRRSGAARSVSPGLLALGFSVIVVLLGEGMLASLFIYDRFAAFSLMATFKVMSLNWQNLPTFGAVLRLLTAASFGGGIHAGCRPLKVKLDI